MLFIPKKNITYPRVLSLPLDIVFQYVDTTCGTIWNCKRELSFSENLSVAWDHLHQVCSIILLFKPIRSVLQMPLIFSLVCHWMSIVSSEILIYFVSSARGVETHSLIFHSLFKCIYWMLAALLEIKKIEKNKIYINASEWLNPGNKI